MDDKPTNEEPKKEFNKLDLTQLESFSFGTEWTKDKPQPGGGSRGRDDRPRRDGPRDDRRDRRGFKRSSGPVPGQGPGGGGRDRRPGGERPARDGRGHGQRDDRRGGGRPPIPQGPYISPYFDATFYPEDVSFSALAKTIRSSARTFELFDIAKTVIGKNDRFVVVLERKPGKDNDPKQPFFVCLLDGIPFETEEAAMNHVVQKHLSRFFEVSEVEADPPKGSFQVINRCGVTGALLGPPNYHLYTQIVQQHHASQLPRMSFDNFSHRIESVRDPEVVEQWLESMKKVIRYTWLGDANVPTKPEAAPVAEAPPGPAAKTAEATAEPAVTEAPVAEETTAPAENVSPEASEPTPTAAADDTPEMATAEEAPAAASPEAEAEVAAESVAPAAAPQPTFDSATEAKIHLLTHARDKCVRTYEHGRFHGRALDDMPDGEIKRAVVGALERQQRFPLDTANALRGRLRREGFTIFKKGSKGISYVSAVKRKFRVAGQTFADSIDGLITFIEKNPMVKVSELTEKFLQIAPPETKPVDGEAPAPTATTPATVSPFGEADQPRIKRMQLDLRWLVTEGYVTEFIDGTLFAAPPMPPAKPKPSPEKAPAAPAAAASPVPPVTPEAPASPADEAPTDEVKSRPAEAEAPAAEPAPVETASPIEAKPAPIAEAESPPAAEVEKPVAESEAPREAAAESGSAGEAPAEAETPPAPDKPEEEKPSS